MLELSIKKIAEAVGGKLYGPGDEMISAVSTDTRTIKKGCLFIAIVGEKFDGHQFISKAFEQGAAAVISRIPVDTDRPVILVEDTRKAYGALAAYYRSLFPVFLVGVTGSVGKTSTKEMIYTVMSQKYHVLKTQGNFNNDIGLPKTLLEMDSGHTGAVIEMGMSALGEISYLSQIAKPNLGVITNIGVSHLENLGTRDNILKAKLEILDGMDDSAKLILNKDNDKLASLENVMKDRIRYFGIENPADVTAEEICQQGNSTVFTVVYEGRRYPAKIPAIGIHNVYNALAGFLVGIEIGLTPHEIIASYENYQNSGMRQNVTEYDGIKVIADCYNASPDSMKAAIEVISHVECTGKRIAVLGDMLELGQLSAQFHKEVGKMVANSKIDLLLCYGTEALHICEGAKQAGFGEVFHFHSKENMVSYIKSVLQKGDAIIFKASRGVCLEEVMEKLFPNKD